LDVGAGVGALTFELLDRGVRRAVIVEASAGYTAAASNEATRRGRATDIDFVSGDFLEVAGTVPMASVVALDRVVCDCRMPCGGVAETASEHSCILRRRCVN
jgi:16S rRNA G966 N2-methylase RsmD